jgi:SAM-dependent methyltransferase
MDKAATARIELALRWESPGALHQDRLFLSRVNLWRDLFPGNLGEALTAEAGARAARSFAAGELVPEHTKDQVHRVRREQFHPRWRSSAPVEPRVGRFYPRGFLTEIPGTFPQDRRPFRLLDASADTLFADLNHPLSQCPLAVEVTLLAMDPRREERGGRCADLAEELAQNGPGMQAALPWRETDFLAGNPFAREDSRDDAEFYAEPRLVHHLDATALDQVRALYGRFLRPGMRILDLMSSWTSHLPAECEGLEVTGLGMNREELEKNPRLCRRVVHDLNVRPSLPFNDGAFDLALCTVSVEYLTRPLEVFREAARVLRPGGVFVLTFSERWFPPKVVRIWTELHPFERMGLVLHYFREAGGFDQLHSESVRGLDRPADDKYAGTLAFSDPVYAVWGVRGPQPAAGSR